MACPNTPAQPPVEDDASVSAELSVGDDVASEEVVPPSLDPVSSGGVVVELGVPALPSAELGDGEAPVPGSDVIAGTGGTPPEVPAGSSGVFALGAKQPLGARTAANRA